MSRRLSSQPSVSYTHLDVYKRQASASAAMFRAQGREMDTLPGFRFVTGSLHVDFLKPTPISETLEIRGRIKEIKGRKVVVEATVYAAGVATAKGEVVAIQMPENFGV